MKALILAAGYGTRLRPYTRTLPKPLFTIGGRTVLDILIGQLQSAGCTALTINTHHLADRIETWVKSRHFPIPVKTCHEPEILGTGGAIANALDFLGATPFMVVNADILTDIDFAAVYGHHLAHSHPVTMVLHDLPRFNQVLVGKDRTVSAILPSPVPSGRRGDHRAMAFTGIQVIDPEVCRTIPRGVFSSSIDLYRGLLAQGRSISAWIAEKPYWADIGTPQGYRRAVFETLSSEAFQRAFGKRPTAPVTRRPMAGDGSDRTWYRLTAGKHSLVMVDHGIDTGDTTEAASFIRIARHLARRGIPVPALYAADPLAGQAFLQDLGGLHLQQAARRGGSREELSAAYRTVIDLTIRMNRRAARGFDPAWCFQGGRYDRELILEKECRYFTTAFVAGYLGLPVSFEVLRPEFERLAAGALSDAVTGFMHRDLQSRNIMVTNDRFYLIDFQAGRLGPLQYDLASLLIDPYVDLPFDLQMELLDYAVAHAGASNPERFRRGYRHCALARNLQILGAFAFLSREKGKPWFEQYIPAAVKSLQRLLNTFPSSAFPGLKALAKSFRLPPAGPKNCKRFSENRQPE
jgi:NDP-sugar pyrophosphorylase family protein